MEATLRQWQAVVETASSDPDWSRPEEPASDAEIAAAEKTMRRKLPAELRAMLKASRAWLWREEGFDAVVFHPPAEIATAFEEPDDEMDVIAVSSSNSTRAKPIFYSPRRITFAFSDYHRFQIDEDPTPAGKVGQILVIDFEEETIDVIADSFEDFVRHGIDCLQRQLQGGYPADAE